MFALQILSEFPHRHSPAEINQAARNHILNRHACIAARNADQDLKIVGYHRDQKWWQEGDERQAIVDEQRPTCDGRLIWPYEVVKTLQVIPQSDADDRKTGADGEHWEQGKVVVDYLGECALGI